MYRRDNSLSRERGSRNLFEKLGHGQHGLVDHRCAICTPDSSSSRPWNSFSWANCPADSRSPRFPLISNRPGSDDIREVNPIRSAQIRRSSRLPEPFTPRRVSKYHLPRSDAVHGQYERGGRWEQGGNRSAHERSVQRRSHPLPPCSHERDHLSPHSLTIADAHRSIEYA